MLASIMKEVVRSGIYLILLFTRHLIGQLSLAITDIQLQRIKTRFSLMYQSYATFKYFQKFSTSKNKPEIDAFGLLL